jgi:riboflavin kinase/FMN adenylyltransferase
MSVLPCLSECRFLGIVGSKSKLTYLSSMKHFYNLSDARLTQPSIITIGIFDGVHRGHQYLIKQLATEAQRDHKLSVVLTLFPHPDKVLRGQTGRYYLTSPDQKARLLGTLGVDVVVTHPFDDSVRQMRAASFIDELRAHLNMVSLWVTTDFAMGYRREGDFTYLSAQGQQKGFEVRAVDLLMNNGHHPISSSAIREALQAGDVERAANWLGRFYQVEGPVVHGDDRGHAIGFPTANIEVWAEQVIPQNGVYACWAYLGDRRYMAVANVGKRPTFEGDDTIRVEAHLLDFRGDVYGQVMALGFVARLRDEQKFSSLEALVQQIGADVERGRTLLKTRA